REALVERIDLLLRELDARGREPRVAGTVHLGVHLERLVLPGFTRRPGDPRAFLALAEEREQRRDDAVGRRRAPAHDAAVLDDFVVGQPVIDDHELGLAGPFGVADGTARTLGTEQTEVLDRVQDSAAPGMR